MMLIFCISFLGMKQGKKTTRRLPSWLSRGHPALVPVSLSKYRYNAFKSDNLRCNMCTANLGRCLALHAGSVSFLNTDDSGSLLVLSHAQSADLCGEIVDASLQSLHQVALSCRQVGAHL